MAYMKDNLRVDYGMDRGSIRVLGVIVIQVDMLMGSQKDREDMFGRMDLCMREHW